MQILQEWKKNLNRRLKQLFIEQFYRKFFIRGHYECQNNPCPKGHSTPSHPFEGRPGGFQYIEDMRPEQREALDALRIYTHPGLKVSQLAAALAIHPSTCSNMLDKLEAEDLLVRDRSKTDQRAVHIFLTAKGSS